MPATVNERVRKRRETMRASGLRPIQIWVPDTRAPGFEEECRRQSLIVARADGQDAELSALLDTALDDILDDRG